MKIKLLSLTLFFLLNSSQSFAEIYEVNNEKIKMLLENSVPLIDIRTEGEWHETGVINSSHLLTFFDKDGNYNFKKWMIEVEEIADENGPVIIMCRSGRRSRIVSNMIIKQNSEYLIYHVTNGIKSWIESSKKTVKPD
jgi:rhodanese-related sulfurtransferase